MTRLKGIAVSGAVIALLALSAAAQTAPATDDCRKTAANERELAACLAKLTKEQGAAMATSIRALKQRYTEPSEKSFAPTLDKAQRAWATWRDAECGLKTWESRQGSGYANIRAACLLDENAARLKTLQEMVDNP